MLVVGLYFTRYIYSYYYVVNTFAPAKETLQTATLSMDTPRDHNLHSTREETYSIPLPPFELWHYREYGLEFEGLLRGFVLS